MHDSRNAPLFLVGPSSALLNSDPSTFSAAPRAPCTVKCACSVTKCDVSLFPTLAYGTPWLVMHVSTSLVGVLCADPRSPTCAPRFAPITRLALQLCFCLASRRLLLLLHTTHHYHHYRFAYPSPPPVARRLRSFQVAFSDRTLGAFPLYSCERSELDPWSRNSKEPDNLRVSVAKSWRNLIALA